MSNTIRPHYLILLDWKDQSIFLNNTDHPIYWEHEGKLTEFKGAGHVGSIDGLDENSELSEAEVVLHMALIPEIDVMDINPGDYQGRKIYVWEIRLDENYVVSEHKQRWIGYMSHHTVSVSDEAHVISLYSSDRSVNWSRSANHLINQERQTECYPNDNICKYMNELKNAVIKL